MNVLSRRLERIERRMARKYRPDPLDEAVSIYDEFIAPAPLVEVVLHQPRDHAVPCQVPGHRHRTFAFSALCWDDAA